MPGIIDCVGLDKILSTQSTIIEEFDKPIEFALFAWSDPYITKAAVCERLSGLIQVSIV